MIITAHDGETIDAVMWRAAQWDASYLPQILSANKQHQGRLFLSAGDKVIIPEINVTAPKQRRISLWD